MTHLLIRIDSLKDTYQQWCKETHRGGSVLVGGSIREFLDYLQTNSKKVALDPESIDTKTGDYMKKIESDPTKYLEGMSEVDLVSAAYEQALKDLL